MVISLVQKMFKSFDKEDEKHKKINNLSQGTLNKEYEILKIKTKRDDLRDFLFSLGCFEGEKVKIVSVLSDNYSIIINNAKYCIDKELAELIIIN
ncbi:MAG: FeoA family protein [Bacillota bacterium]